MNLLKFFWLMIGMVGVLLAMLNVTSNIKTAIIGLLLIMGSLGMALKMHFDKRLDILEAKK